VFAKEGGYPGVTHPLVPRHEIAGAIESLGEGVRGGQVGHRVAIGWFGGNCGYFEWLRRGLLMDCENMEVMGITIRRRLRRLRRCGANAVASMPDDLEP
jgi:D-arabinose 1-dehydrogenase-like Zn-dependent alcohol dehydrogenase